MAELCSRSRQTVLRAFIVLEYTVADHVHARLHAYLLALLQHPWSTRGTRTSKDRPQVMAKQTLVLSSVSANFSGGLGAYMWLI